MDYIQLATRTECPITEEVLARINKETIARLIHACLGLTTETGEFADQLKRHLFYGAPLDKTNLDEEIGDILWYIAVCLDAVGVKDIETTMLRNLNKLRSRYPEKFTERDALNRNLEREIEALRGRP